MAPTGLIERETITVAGPLVNKGGTVVTNRLPERSWMALPNPFVPWMKTTVKNSEKVVSNPVPVITTFWPGAGLEGVIEVIVGGF
jgi:hypothetical protein